MSAARSLDADLDRLFKRLTLGVKPGLDTVRRLCELVGNPQDSFVSIHIAGTNGKGSVAAMIAAVLESVGLRTGLYTSPHLVRFHERIRIQGADIGDALLKEVLAECEQASQQVLQETGREPTFFEMTTAMAFLAFQRSGIQIAVLETGMGGRLDATNIVTPLVSVITRVAMDHQKWLGDTLEAVAGEKAGIIKPERPVIMGTQEPDAEAVIKRTATDRYSPLVEANVATTVQAKDSSIHEQKLLIETRGGWLGTVALPLVGTYQLENAAVAITTLETVFAAIGMDVDFTSLKTGLKQVRWRGRCEVLMDEPLVIADAAHNPSGAAALIKTLKQNKIRKVMLLTGMCGDKDVAEVTSWLGQVAGEIWTVPISSERSLDPATLARYYNKQSCIVHCSEDLSVALHDAIEKARSEALPLLVAGSIFLLGDVLSAMPQPD